MKKLITFLFAGVTCVAVMIGVAGIKGENGTTARQMSELTGSGKLTMLLGSGNNSYNVHTGSGNNTSTGSGNSTWTGGGTQTGTTSGNNTSSGGTQTGTTSGNNTSSGGTQTGTTSSNNTSGGGTGTNTGSNTSGGTGTATGNNTSGGTGTATGNNTQVGTPEKTSPVLLTVAETEENATATAHGVTLRWKANRYVSQYAVFRKTKSSKWIKISDASFSLDWSGIGEKEVVILSAFDATIQPDTVYTYSVRGVDKDGKYVTSFDTNGLSLRTRASQTVINTNAPVITGAEASGNSIVVTWNANEGVDQYVVFRKTGNSGWTKLNTVTGVRYEDQSAERGTEYYYTVRGVNAVGKYITNYNTTGVAAKLELGYDDGAPVLGDAVISENSIKISWQKNQGVEQYVVFRRSGNSGWTKLSTVAGDNFYTDASAKVGVNYVYTVRGISAAGKYITSYNQTGVSAMIPAPVIDKSAPTLTGISVSDNGITVTWTQNTGVDNYKVFRRTANTKWTAIAVVAGNSYTDCNAVAGVAYIYTIRGISVDGNYITAFDQTGLSATIPAPVIDKSAPTLTGISGSANGITVTWAQNTGVDSYRVFRRTANTKWTMVADVTGGSCTDCNVVAGEEYIYTVRGISAEGTYITAFDATGITIKFSGDPAEN